MLLGAALYTLLIAKMNNWGAYGWGPRYLLPCLPILFWAATPGLMALNRRSRRGAAVLVLAALAWNVAPSLVNWQVVAAEYPGAPLEAAAAPYQIIGVWKGLWRGLHAEPLVFANSDPVFAAQDMARRFPDLWTARLMERSRSGRLAGGAIILALLAGIVLSSRRILRPHAALLLVPLPASPPAPPAA
jgi:hypothetical protein